MARLNIYQDAFGGSELAQFPATIVDWETVVIFKPPINLMIIAMTQPAAVNVAYTAKAPRQQRHSV